MRNILVVVAFFIGQIAMQDTPVVRLTSNRAAIQAQWGGMRVELINAPSSVFLPLPPPATDSLGPRLANPDQESRTRRGDGLSQERIFNQDRCRSNG